MTDRFNALTGMRMIQIDRWAPTSRSDCDQRFNALTGMRMIQIGERWIGVTLITMAGFNALTGMRMIQIASLELTAREIRFLVSMPLRA